MNPFEAVLAAHKFGLFPKHALCRFFHKALIRPVAARAASLIYASTSVVSQR
jgi:hypothetical protein